MRKCIVVGILLLGVAGVTACAEPAGSEATTPAGPTSAAARSTTGKVGEALTIETVSGAKAKVSIVSVKLSNEGKGEYADKPANGQFAVVDVEIAVTAGTYAVNPLYLRYQTTDNKTYESGAGNAFNAGFEPALASGDLPPGQSVRGVVVFDVPASKGKQIQIMDEVGSLIGVWAI
jgi:hypothetical protein